MEVRIGVTYSAKELTLDLADGADPDALKKDVEAVLEGTSAVLWVTDRKGRTVGVPAEKVAYVELDPSGEDRRVGFGTS